MRKYSLLAALAGAVFAAAVAMPNRADAMTFSTPAGVLSAAAAADAAQPEQVRWCGWRGCWGGYWGVRPFYGYRYYRPYWGWGYRRWWW
jgi:hypothetical protein